MKNLAIVFVLLAGCPAAPPVVDAGTTEATRIPSACKTACANLRKLRCWGYEGSPGADETFGTADDVSCERVCADFEVAAQQSPVFSMHPACITSATTCSAVSLCNR